MTDQPVTPDREALIRVAYNEMEARWPEDTKALVWDDAVAAVDALLPFLTDALDRARQQGRDEGRDEGLDDAYAIVASEASRTFGPNGENTPAAEPCLRAQRRIREQHSQHAGNVARLARGGPNRKDDE